MRTVVLLFSLFFSILGAEAVSAQPVDPIAAYLALNGSAEEREDLRSMAKCIAQRYPELVQIVIRSQDITQDGSHRLIDKDCFKTRFFRKSQFMITSWYYSVLAECLLIVDYRSTDLPDLIHVPPLDHPELPATDLSKMPAQYRASFIVSHWVHKVDTAAECAARAMPGTVYGLMQSKPDSSQEGQFFKQLQGTLAVCQLATLSPTPTNSSLRAAPGENLYRLFDYAKPINHKKAAPSA